MRRSNLGIFGFLMLALCGCASAPISSPSAVPVPERVEIRATVVSQPPSPTPAISTIPEIKFDPLARLHRIEDRARDAPRSAEKDIKTLATYLTRYCRSDEQKALAIFAWITSHIKYDYYGAAHDEELPEQDAASVLARREGVCAGYSSLFVGLAEAAGLRAVYLTGYIKSWDKIVVDDDDYHAWNAVYWRNQWHLLDATWGVGRRSPGPRTYPPRYFDVEPEKMLASHFPDEAAWQLRSRAPMTRSQFDHQCVRQPEFFDLGLELLDTTDYEMKFDRECTIRLKVPPELELLVTLEKNGKELPPGSVLISRRGDLRAIEVRPPKPGKYGLFFRAARDEDTRFSHVLTHHLLSRSAPRTRPAYPIAADWYQEQEALLHEPLEGVLKKGHQHFHLTAPHARRVSVRNGLKEFPLKKTGDDFEGDCSLETGEAMVDFEAQNASVFSFSRRLLRYEVK